MHEQQVQAGQAVYSPRFLKMYDIGVLGFSCRFLWGCPASRLLQHYNENVRGSHLDVGVGTGYFLDNCVFPVPSPRVTLVDLNANSLAHTARRIARYAPQVRVGNALGRLPLDVPPHQSAAANFLLHCVPGSMREKAVVFDHLAEHVEEGGRIFGSTILARLHGDHLPPPHARAVMSFYRRRGYFANAEDDADTLREELERRFSNVHFTVVGSVALFQGDVRRGSA